jgi:hypothetical protein
LLTAYWITWQKLYAPLRKKILWGFVLCMLGSSLLHAEEEEKKSAGGEELSDEDKDRIRDLQTKPRAGGGMGNSDRFHTYVSRAPYFVLPTMRIPVVRKGVLYAYFFIQSEFKAGEGEWSRVKYMRYRLQHDIFVDLYNALSLLWDGEKDPDPDVIKKRILATCERTFGKGAVLEVFFRRINMEFLVKKTSPYTKKEQ